MQLLELARRDARFDNLEHTAASDSGRDAEVDAGNSERAFEVGRDGKHDPLVEHDRLTELPGIGVALARQIEELFRTEQSELLASLREGLPSGVLELSQVDGVGLHALRTLHEDLGIASIEPTLPVAKSGLQVGDEFVQVGPVKARQRADIQRFVAALRPGTKIKVVVNRNAERKEFTVVLGEANEEVKATFRRLANPNAGDDDEP